MTRKDYKLFAEYLGMERKFLTGRRAEGFDSAVNVIASVFSRDNGRFDREKFLTAYRKFWKEQTMQFENWTGKSLIFCNGYTWPPDGVIELHEEVTDMLGDFHGIALFDGFPHLSLPDKRRGVYLVVNRGIPFKRDDLVYPCFNGGQVIRFQTYESEYIG